MVNTGACLYPLPLTIIPVEPIVTIPPLHLEPEFTLKKNGNCRYGPSQVYEIKTSYLAGNVVPIAGRNDEGSWLYSKPDHCFISIVVGDFNGDINLLPVIEAPPPPDEQPSYSSCGDYSTQALCKQDPGGIGGCYWSPNNFCDQLK
jgi:hypothetical protein